MAIKCKRKFHKYFQIFQISITFLTCSGNSKDSLFFTSQYKVDAFTECVFRIRKYTGQKIQLFLCQATAVPFDYDFVAKAVGRYVEYNDGFKAFVYLSDPVNITAVRNGKVVQTEGVSYVEELYRYYLHTSYSGTIIVLGFSPSKYR